MTNIVPFPGKATSSKRRDELLAEKKAEMEKAGGLAIQNLSSWRRSIPKEEKVRLAKNMEQILNTYGINPSQLNWGDDYESIEAYRRDVSRMRWPASAQPGRRLMGHSYPWLRMLAYVKDYCVANGSSVSMEYLADSLTRGTEFHPTRKIQTNSEKLFYLLTAWANEIDKKHGLLQQYKLLASARAEYFDTHFEDIQPDKYGDEKPDWAFKKVSDEIKRPPEFVEAFELWKSQYDAIPDDPDHQLTPREVYILNEGRVVDYFAKTFEELSESEWIDLANYVGYDATFRREELDEWRRNFSKDQSLSLIQDKWFSVSLYLDTPYFPRWFIGYGATAQYRIALPDSDHWLAEVIQKEGTDDPINHGHDLNFESHVGYLVLYPDIGLNRICPYVFVYSEEGTRLKPLTIDDLDEIDPSSTDDNIFYKPEEIGKQTISRSLLVRVEESKDEIYEHWNATVGNLQRHPYLRWIERRDKSIDESIQALLDRSEHKRSGRKRKDG